MSKHSHPCLMTLSLLGGKQDNLDFQVSATSVHHVWTKYVYKQSPQHQEIYNCGNIYCGARAVSSGYLQRVRLSCSPHVFMVLVASRLWAICCCFPVTAFLTCAGDAPRRANADTANNHSRTQHPNASGARQHGWQGAAQLWTQTMD